MVYFLPIIPAVDPGPDGSGGSLWGILLMVNLFFNGLPCVLTALALWRTARWQRVRRPWLALIPVADLWVLGSLSDRYHKQVRGKEKRMRKVLPLLGAAALATIPLMELILGLVAQLPMLLLLLLAYGVLAVWSVLVVYRIMALCDLYTGYGRGKPAKYIIFSILCPPLIPFFIFRCHW